MRKLMVYDIYYGEISDVRKGNWELEDDDPFMVLIENRRVTNIGWVSFLQYANENFRESIQIDWESYAYKCNKSELIEFSKKIGASFIGLYELEDGFLGINFN